MKRMLSEALARGLAAGAFAWPRRVWRVAGATAAAKALAWPRRTIRGLIERWRRAGARVPAPVDGALPAAMPRPPEPPAATSPPAPDREAIPPRLRRGLEVLARELPAGARVSVVAEDDAGRRWSLPP